MKIKIPTENDIFPKFYGEVSLKIQEKMPYIKDMLKTGLVPEELDEFFVSGYSRTYSSGSFDLMRARETYIHNFGFFLLNEKLLDMLSCEFEGDKIIEVGAGSGWLSYNLQQRGLNVIPVDCNLSDNHYNFKKLYTNIVDDKAEDFILKNKYDTILMCWPDLGSDFAHTILDRMPKNKNLIYIGESEGGCTANDDFFELLNSKCTLLEDKTKRIQRHVKQWAGIHDQIEVYRT